eukprot:5121401-Amphidinium_carterae.1
MSPEIVYRSNTYSKLQRAKQLTASCLAPAQVDMLSLLQQVQQEFFEPISCILARNFAAALAASTGDSKLQESATRQVRARNQANAPPLALCAAAAAAEPVQPEHCTSASSLSHDLREP